MKAKTITLSILISILTFSLNQNIKVSTIEPAPVNVAVAEPISIINKGIDYFDIKPFDYMTYKPRCKGTCVSIARDFPYSDYFTSAGNWFATHGTPSTRPLTGAHMWAMDGNSEGVGFKYQFKKGYQYCMEEVFHTRTMDGSSANGSTFLNVQLFPNTPTSPTFTPPAGGFSLASYPFPSFGYSVQTQNFSPTTTYNSAAFWPSNTFFPGVIATISNVIICEDCLTVEFKVYIICSRVFFIPIVNAPSSTTIEGFIWDFGDGSQSNLKYDIHFYANSGTYTVTLTVIGKGANGECCTRRQTYQINIKKCDACEEIKYNTIKKTNLGSINKYEPYINANPLFTYTWNFSDLTTYNTRDVLKDVSIPISLVKLTIYYSDGERCCSATSYYKEFIGAKDVTSLNTSITDDNVNEAIVSVKSQPDVQEFSTAPAGN